MHTLRVEYEQDMKEKKVTKIERSNLEQPTREKLGRK